MNRKILDGIAIISLIFLTAIFALRYVNFSIPPFEDAAMLMRYAEHVSQGERIVWNIGKKPVDGATGFLFMIVVAFLYWDIFPFYHHCTKLSFVNKGYNEIIRR